MGLLFKIRAVIAALLLVMHTSGGPLGHLGIMLFIGRFTRVAAAQQFDLTRAATCSKLVLAQVASRRWDQRLEATHQSTATASTGASNAMNNTHGARLTHSPACGTFGGPYAYSPAFSTRVAWPS